MEGATEVLSLAASVASLVLAVVAIWISLHSKAEADRTNRLTQDLLSEIRGDARAVAQVAMPELKAYGDSIRRFVFEGETGTRALPLEESVSDLMDRLNRELAEIRESTDLRSVKQRLEELEASVRRSKETIQESERDEERRIYITLSEHGGLAFQASAWPEVLEMIMEDGKLQPARYGKEWEVLNLDQGKPLPKEAILSPKRGLTVHGLHGGEELELKLL